MYIITSTIIYTNYPAVPAAVSGPPAHVAELRDSKAAVDLLTASAECEPSIKQEQLSVGICFLVRVTLRLRESGRLN